MTRFFSFFIQVSFLMVCLASPGFSRDQEMITINNDGSPAPGLLVTVGEGASSKSAEPMEYFSFKSPSPKRQSPTRLTAPKGRLSLQASDDSCISACWSCIKDYAREILKNCLTWCVNKCDDCDDDDATPEGGAALESDDD